MKPPFPLLLAALLVCAPLAAEQALFRNASISYGGGSLLDLKAADVNHDGKQDVILLQASGETSVSLMTMFGNGDGSFRAPVKTPVTSSGSIAVADLDGDGNVDVVLSGQYTMLEVYRGNSDGSFTLRSSKKPANILTGSPLVLTDLNGDGKLDLVAATYVGGQFATPLVTFRGNGDGTFADGITQPGPYIQSMNDIAIGDFNGDGRTDVIESSYEGQRMATGKGDGSFNAPVVFANSGRVAGAGDFNGDGKLDCVSMDILDAFSSVHLGNGNGTFTSGGKYVTGEAWRAYPIDFDGDGKLDIVAPGNDLVTVMRGNGDGTFTVRSYTANSNSLAIADFDGDHHLDILAASYPALVFLHGNGDGSLAGYRKSFLGADATSSLLQSSYVGVATADFNGDGKADVVSRNDAVIVMLNSGDASFGPPRPLAVPPGTDAPLAFATGDVNGDGKADVVVAGTRLWSYLGNGDGTFTSAAPTTVPPYFHLTLKDMNGDGKLDAVLSRWDTNGQLLLGNGDGTFATPVALPGNPAQIADFDGDGRLDFVSNNIANGYQIFRSNGNGGYTSVTSISNNLGALAVGDFNNDRKADLVEEMYSGYIRMRLGKSDGTFTDLPAFSVDGLPSGAFPAETATADFDGDGNLDLAFQNQVLLGKGDGTFRAIVPCLLTRPWYDLAAADVDGNGTADLLLLDPQNAAVNALLTRTTPAGTTPLSFTESTSLSTLHPGESVTVTATASTSSTFILSGGIRVDADGVFVGFAPWNDGIASLTWRPLTLGDHTITASYVGDDVFPSRSATVTRPTAKLDSHLALYVSPEPRQQQQPVTIQAIISPKQPSTMVPTGTITIRDGATVLFSGAYSTTTPSLKNYRFAVVGIHTMTLDYSGDVNYTPDSITVDVQVTKAVATMFFSSAPASPLAAGQSLTLQAAISAFMSPNGGTVTFHDFDRDIGTVAVSGSLARITLQPAAGFHSYSATYTGNADLDPVSSSFNLDYTVNGPPCTPAANCLRRHAAH